MKKDKRFCKLDASELYEGSSREKWREDDTDSEEERWLTAIEAGNLHQVRIIFPPIDPPSYSFT